MQGAVSAFFISHLLCIPTFPHFTCSPTCPSPSCIKLLFTVCGFFLIVFLQTLFIYTSHTPSSVPSLAAIKFQGVSTSTCGNGVSLRWNSTFEGAAWRGEMLKSCHDMVCVFVSLTGTWNLPSDKRDDTTGYKNVWKILQVWNSSSSRDRELPNADQPISECLGHFPTTQEAPESLGQSPSWASWAQEHWEKAPSPLLCLGFERAKHTQSLEIRDWISTNTKLFSLYFQHVWI